MVALNTLTRKLKKLEDLHCVQSELDLRQQMLRSLAKEQSKRELALVANTDDPDLVDRLHRAGFTAENLSALAFAPIALVAWASGDVTPQQRASAIEAVFHSDTSWSGSAIAKYQSWLKVRPGEELLELWADVRKASYPNDSSLEQDNDRIIELAHRVAAASGGFMGFGAICEGEQKMIDEIIALLNKE